ncbi:cell division site-positioning protein MapZ [Falseniella ignava]
MSKEKQDFPVTENQEPQFDFEEAKDLTVGQVIRKNEEVEAGVLPEDSILDKYIKQHREEIEADKFETLQLKKEELESAQISDEFPQEIRDNEANDAEVSDTEVDGVEVDDTEVSEVAEELTPSPEESADSDFVLLPLGEENQDMEPLILDRHEAVDTSEEQEKSEEELPTLSRSAQSEPEAGSKKKQLLLGAAAVAAALVLAGSYYVYHQVVRSNQEIQSSSSEQSNQTALQEFNTLYDTFYTDENKTALKNNRFDKLSQLKTLLDKLEGSREHSLAKSKYDSLETQIKAIQDVNDQFETPAITDGMLDTSAKVKSDAKFTEVKTGNTEIDKLLEKAISLGKSQQTSASSSSSSQASSSSTTESSASNSSASSSTTAPARSGEHGGLSDDGVNLQRSVSRVPFNQSAVDDSSNPAWNFADGVLEKILEISRSRGYITGNQYILERVNIVNGNGYYNLYKPDGTYLFTLNCKTGYFVGNGAGHADDLDY